MSNRKRVFYNLICAAFGQILAIAIGLIVPRVLIVGYGSEVNGYLSSVNQFLAYLSLFEAGIGMVALQSLYKFVAENDKQNINAVLAATNKYYKRVGTLYLLGLLVLSFVFPIFSENINYISAALIVFFSGAPNAIGFYFQGKYRILLQAEGKNYIISNLSSIIAILSGIVKILLLLLNVNVVIVIACTAAINLIQFAFIMLYIRRKYRWIDLKVEPDFRAIEQKNYALVHQISGLIFQNTDVVLVTIFCGLKSASVYSIYKLVVSHLETLFDMLPNAVNFAFGQMYQTNIEGFKKTIDGFESLYTGIASAILSVALYLMNPFVRLYTDGVTDVNYDDYGIALLFIIISLMTVSRRCMLNTINYAGHFKKTTLRSIIESAINLIVSIIGACFWGIKGVLLGTVIALLYRNNDIVIYANVKLLDRSPLRTYAIHAVNFFLVAVFQFWYPTLFKQIDNYMLFALYGLIMTVVTVVSFLVIHTLFFREFRSFLVNAFIKIRRKVKRDNT